MVLGMALFLWISTDVPPASFWRPRRILSKAGFYPYPCRCTDYPLKCLREDSSRVLWGILRRIRPLSEKRSGLNCLHFIWKSFLLEIGGSVKGDEPSLQKKGFQWQDPATGTDFPVSKITPPFTGFQGSCEDTGSGPFRQPG